MVCGQPKRDIQPVSRARATVSAVMSGMGMASGQRVKRSTAVRQYVWPSDVGRGPTRSMWTWRNLAAGGVKSPSGVTVWRETLERWHDWQSTCPDEAILLYAWPHKTLCDQLRCWFGVARRTEEWLRWWGPAAIVNDRPVLSSERERAPYQPTSNCLKVINIWS
jgi:hypothetical protein